MKKILLSAGLFCASFMANAQCQPVASFTENFENFVAGNVAGALPQNCWTSNEGSPRVLIAETNGNKALQFYTSSNPMVAFYAFSPELTTIDGNHSLSFTISTPSAVGSISIQVGTVTSPADYANFVAVGNRILVNAASTQSNIVIPASTTQKHIAFKVVSVSPQPHAATTIDNISWQPTLSVNDSEFANFNVYPNPATDRNITIAYNANSSEKGKVAVYSLTGAKIFETDRQENMQTLNLSGISSGIYLLKIQSGSNIATKKLILK